MSTASGLCRINTLREQFLRIWPSLSSPSLSRLLLTKKLNGHSLTASEKIEGYPYLGGVRQIMKLVCEKYKEQMAADEACCRHPKEYCKFRTSCMIQFVARENGGCREEKKPEQESH